MPQNDPNNVLKDKDSELHNMRHSCAHMLAQAVLSMFPEAKLGIGPTIENGFYYDFDLPRTLIPEDLEILQEKMVKIANERQTFERREEPIDRTIEFFQKAGQPYKAEIASDLKDEGETVVSFYENRLPANYKGTAGQPGELKFSDLCRGGHTEHTGKTGVFKLMKIAGAYWRGDEKRPMLQRIYGVCFQEKKELNDYLQRLAEAEKRDHRKLGKSLGLFVFSELVGSGLPLFTPKGTIIRELLNDYVWELRKKKGFQKVTIPHITKKDLYDVSGHWAKFSDDLFKINTREGHLFAIKPMNCPHHTQIFDSEPRSYRDMPQRYCETTMVYRDEQTGELSGLSRVLSITQDDAHVFCREDQIEDEAFAIWDIIDTFYHTFGFELKVRFSRHDPTKFEKYLGTKEIWEKAESAMLRLIQKRGVEYIDGLGEAAMYGPKIDFIANDSLGRTLQVATIQLDFNQPRNFKLFFTNEKGEKEPVVMVHCAIMGSIERFMSTLIEHLAGAFPSWLAPLQVAILPVSDKHLDYAREVCQRLLEKGVRVEVDDASESLGKKIRAAELKKVPYMLVVGDKEVELNQVAVRSFKTKEQTSMAVEAFESKILEEISERRL